MKRNFDLVLLRAFAAAFCILTCLAQSFGQGWQNPANRFDVSGDGFLGTDDWHQVFSEIAEPVFADPPGTLPDVATPPPFFDVSGDNFITGQDINQMITEQNNNNSFSFGIPEPDKTISGPASISLRFEDTNGTSIQSVNVGESFVLKATLSDDRNDPLGVFGAYLDLVFDQSLAQASKAQFSDSAQFPVPGELTDFGLDEVGTILISSPTALPRLFDSDLFSMEFTALAPGEFTVSGDEGYAMLLGILDAIDPTIGSASLSIVPEPATASLLLLSLGAYMFRPRRS